MKMGKPHLVASLIMMAASIAYTIWSFQSAPVTAARAQAPEELIDGPAASSGSAPAPIDPTTIAPVPDVALDRLPLWPRNPFVPVRPAVEETLVLDVAAPVVDTAPEPDIVVSGIMYAPPRRSAMVNGRRYNVGDRIGAETIVDINPNGIVLESPERGRRTIEKRPRGSSVGTARTGRPQ